ncbi:hypothetical protein HHI36_016449 [Cryptolaemus montrouzieri]|uniref:FP protein C-terminal domain-containing protein n=1 Tax=Cryptolaemus montrouzieri TaxID=559131 RepID=A0ABD2NJQ9_9CUCU
MKMVSDLTNEIKELRKDTASMKVSMEFINQQFEEERNKSKVLSEMVTDLNRENGKMRIELDDIKKFVSRFEYEKIQNNVVISGLLNRKGESDHVEVAENTDGMVLDLFKKMDHSISKDDFELVRTINNISMPMIVVKVKNLDIKKKIFDGKRRFKGQLTVSNCGLGEANRIIYIREDLTKWQQSLFKSARRLRDVGYKFVWHSNGEILARKSDGSKITKITSEDVITGLMG